MLHGKESNWENCQLREEQMFNISRKFSMSMVVIDRLITLTTIDFSSIQVTTSDFQIIVI